ncbi:MAG: UvrD-helicase domain-containing protein, partial [Dehalococcoidia bacterium]
MATYQIVGPPGTGKTTTLQRQVEHDVGLHGSDAVLITSLTRAAAAEVKGRHLPLPDAQVGTLHSHCWRALDRPELAEKRLDEWNDYAPIYAVRTDSRADLDDTSTHRADDPYAERDEGDGDQLMAHYQLLRARLTPRTLWPVEVAAFAERWETWKREADVLDFADLIDVAYETLPQAPGGPRFLYVDEGQDHDAGELRLLHAWGQHAERLYLIADPDQCIFSWRGADPHVFRTPVPPEQRKVLSRSYRVPRAV